MILNFPVLPSGKKNKIENMPISCLLTSLPEALDARQECLITIQLTELSFLSEGRRRETRSPSSSVRVEFKPTSPF